MVAYNERYMWEDPLERDGGSGVLLSDQIDYYAGAVRLIDPFDASCLRPASYDLTVGDEYYKNDCGKPLRKEEVIEIPSNGLVYVKTKESFNIPYYLVGRYSLRVQQVYRGLLVDNGLQVDPGYCGPITVPVHNLTNDLRKLKYGEKFLSVDFTRTTKFKPNVLEEIGSEKDLVNESDRLTGIRGHKLVIFWKSPDAFKKPKGVRDLWIPGETHQSSLEAMREELNRVAEKAKELTETVSKFKTFSALALLALVVTLFSLIISHFYWTSGKYSDALTRVEQVRGDMKVVQDHDLRAQDLAKQVQELSLQLKSLQDQRKKPVNK